MKKTEIAMIILIASVSVLIAYFVGNSLFGKMTNAGEKVKTIQTFSADVNTPDASSPIFNANNINPTIRIDVTNPTNPSEE